MINKNSIKKNKYLIILIIIAILIVVYIIFTQSNNQKRNPDYPTAKPIISYDIFDNSVELAGVDTGIIKTYATFKLDTNLKELNGYGYEKFCMSDSYIDRMTKIFNTKPTSETRDKNNIMIDTANQDITLTFYVSDNYILYYPNKYIVSEENFSATDSYQNYLDKTLEIPRKLEIPTNMYKFDSYVYYKDVPFESVEVNNIGDANTIEYIYNADYEGIPIIDKKGNITPNSIRVFITSNGDISKVIVQPVGTIDKDIKKTFYLKDTQTVVDDIKNGEGKLMNGTFPPAEDILTTYLEKGTVSYYANNGMIIPVYVLTGKTTTKEHNTGTGYVVENAIKTFSEKQK